MAFLIDIGDPYSEYSKRILPFLFTIQKNVLANVIPGSEYLLEVMYEASRHGRKQRNADIYVSNAWAMG